MGMGQTNSRLGLLTIMYNQAYSCGGLKVLLATVSGNILYH